MIDKTYPAFIPIPYRREALFSQEIEMKTEELRRWTPHIVIETCCMDETDMLESNK